ncbi:probable 39S ribosomal protein L23, mitochondrial [Orussus abietinus]|uniref:probable 39S ribosomal protein L23, mitochondrial n=1 Tax=Orussus abietinus TaxID=222816 RepID=UPI00062633B1|nr:probable 39S ribosomal protein L23, mitochondrial [Orussus abietinus]XP_012279946.1 probable 39S ribosomal protein L23, mitochondrial [Orussus abietinus]XP_012279947.1 probable 39S ribosomal protein L23, mitochondrial [Orussus abietinus]XP_012279949.1 probable 39S ribosomal protein L23, mitochondrial [Orussus abietinus]
MSTRWYPLYQRGNPQLRVFLPNFWMKLVKPDIKQPPNIVQFHCSMKMTKYDIRNYLEKIYKIPVVEVRTRIAPGKTEQGIKTPYVIKYDDYKVAYVVLPQSESFTFPDLFIETEKPMESEKKMLEEAKKEHKAKCKKETETGIPNWYSF